MRISALTVCVQYADLLANSLPLWMAGCEQLVVVTSPRDQPTLDLCHKAGVVVMATDAFYRDGAVFNKALAICEAIAALAWFDDWQLFFDADIVPPAGWRQVVEAASPVPGFLYGAKRFLENGEFFNDRSEIPGYFQLFHSSDPRVQQRPLLDVSWKHAGGADSYFHQRWKMEFKVWLPMELVHQGKPGRNWCGRGNDSQMDKLLAERARCKGIGRHERFR